MNLSFLFSGDVVTVVVDGAVHAVKADDPRFIDVRAAIKKNDKEMLLSALNPVVVSSNKPVVTHAPVVKSNGIVVAKDGQVFFNGQVLHNKIVENIASLQAQGLPFDGMAKFLERLYNNTSNRVREQLFGFIENKYGFAVDEDGYLLAYKAVQNDWYDKHTGNTYCNTIGSVIEMDRGSVNDDPDDACGAGLHAGSLNYISGFGNSGDRIVIVRIDPADVVSIPKDCSCEKIRCCRYEVVAEYQRVLSKPVYTTQEVKEMKSMPAKIVDHVWTEVEDDCDDDSDDSWDSWLDEDCDYDSDDDYVENDPIESSERDVEAMVQEDSMYGVKPTGHKFYNRRGPDGKFC